MVGAVLPAVEAALIASIVGSVVVWQALWAGVMPRHVQQQQQRTADRVSHVRVPVSTQTGAQAWRAQVRQGPGWGGVNES